MPQRPEIHRRDGADALLGHVHAVDRIHGGHGRLVVGDDDELGVFGELPDNAVELLDVGVVQRGIHFIENAKGGWLE